MADQGSLTLRKLADTYSWSDGDVEACSEVIGGKPFSKRSDVAAKQHAAELVRGAAPKGAAQKLMERFAKELKENNEPLLLRRLIKMGMADEVRKRLRRNPNIVLKIPPRVIECGQSDVMFCQCFTVEEHITPLGVAVSRGHGYRAIHRSPPNPRMLRTILECGADPNRCWSQRRVSKSRLPLNSEWAEVHPLRRAQGAPFAQIMLLAYGSLPPSAKITAKLIEDNILSPPNYWLRRFGIVHVVPRAAGTDILRFLIVARACTPPLHRDVVGIIARLLARP
jgi:hypothetical protein